MDITIARVFVAGLLIDCPYEPDPKGCALHDIRQKPLRERVEWSRQLTDEQVQEIMQIHKKCLARREVWIGDVL